MHNKLSHNDLKPTREAAIDVLLTSINKEGKLLIVMETYVQFINCSQRGSKSMSSLSLTNSTMKRKKRQAIKTQQNERTHHGFTHGLSRENRLSSALHSKLKSLFSFK